MLRSANARTSTSGLPLPGFQISEPARSGRASVIAVSGELDLATAPQLREALARALTDVDHEVIVDMSGVTFIDSTALRVLLDAQRTRGSARPLVVVCDQLNVLRIIKITAFAGAFEIFSTLEKAVERVRERPSPRT